MPTYTGTPGTIAEASGGTSNEKAWSPYTASYVQTADSDLIAATPWHDSGAAVTAVKTKIVRCTDFGFAVPGGETITAISGVIRGQESYPDPMTAPTHPDLNITDFLVQLRDSGGYINSNEAAAYYWGILHDWGYVFEITGLDPTVVNDSSFGLDIQVAGVNSGSPIPTGTLGVPSALIDLVQLTITTEGDAGGGGGGPGSGSSFSNMGKFRRIPEGYVRNY